jgi:hypothetical protein
VEENAPFFRRDYGGIQGRKKNGTPLGEIYFIGIIDILTTYSYGKSAENFVKSLFVNKVPPSCVRALMCGVWCVCSYFCVASCSACDLGSAAGRVFGTIQELRQHHLRVKLGFCEPSSAARGGHPPTIIIFRLGPGQLQMFGSRLR